MSGYFTKRLTSAFAMFLGAMWSSVAMAQENERLPNSTDLKAAYCIAVEQGMVTLSKATLEAFKRTPSETMSAQERQKQLSLLEQNVTQQTSNLHRLQAYLLPRSLYLDPMGLALAMNRGKADMNTFCSSTTTVNASRCADQCATLPNGTDRRQCLDRCLPYGLRERIMSCSHSRLSWLPF